MWQPYLIRTLTLSVTALATACKSAPSVGKGSSNSGPLKRTSSARFVGLTSSGHGKCFLFSLCFVQMCVPNNETVSIQCAMCIACVFNRLHNLSRLWTWFQRTMGLLNFFFLYNNLNLNCLCTVSTCIIYNWSYWWTRVLIVLSAIMNFWNFTIWYVVCAYSELWCFICCQNHTIAVMCSLYYSSLLLTHNISIWLFMCHPVFYRVVTVWRVHFHRNQMENIFRYPTMISKMTVTV